MLRTEVLPGEDPRAIEAAAALLRAGEPVAFPTETVYGLGAIATDPMAVARVFEVKGRPRFDPLIVHLASYEDVGRYAVAADARDPRVAALAERFWPGPLTVVLRKRDVIPGIVTAGLDTVALRVPDHPVALSLIGAVGEPLAAPSANPFGRLSPTSAAHVARQLDGRIPLVLDGGPSRIGVESTVVLLADGQAALLRPGGLPAEAIEQVTGRLERPGPGEGERLSPGRAASHYAPGPPVVLLPAGASVPSHAGRRVGLLAADDAGRAEAERVDGPFAAIEVLAPDGDPVVAASRLFEALHRLDDAGLDLIVAQPVPESGLGLAVMDRLRRAVAATMPR
ncbi:MAG TPA: L-threonylcarbamoyladenylate synthase [Candidatus Dormibacteraeota bacterium]|nr:L-threonylcarbamoyladenylate synthase [Candidatus Dormibacteraeota bacterium]